MKNEKKKINLDRLSYPYWLAARHYRYLNSCFEHFDWSHLKRSQNVTSDTFKKCDKEEKKTNCLRIAYFYWGDIISKNFLKPNSIYISRDFKIWVG